MLLLDANRGNQTPFPDSVPMRPGRRIHASYIRAKRHLLHGMWETCAVKINTC